MLHVFPLICWLDVFYVSSFISFFSILQLPVYKFFTSLAKLIPKYFILSVAIMNGVIFLISFLDNLLTMYRNIPGFMLIMFLATLLNLFINFNTHFLIDLLEFSMYMVASSAYRNTFTFLILIWLPFISFPCLIVLTRTSSTMLNRSDESGNPFHCTQSYITSFKFSFIDYYLAVGFLYTNFTVSK